MVGGCGTGSPTAGEAGQPGSSREPDQPRTDRNEAGVLGPSPLWILLLLIPWWATLVRQTLSNGDAPTYLTQIRDINLFLRTVHIGYLASALPLVHWLPGDPGLRLNIVSVAWSLAAAVALVRIEALTAPDGRATGWTLAWCAACPPVLAAATTAEVYPAQTALVLWALVAWGRRRPVAAGVTWFLSMTVSPTALAALPAFWLFRAPRRAWWGLVLGGVAPLVVLAWALSGDYLWGIRGLLTTTPGMGLVESALYRLEATPATLGFSLLVLPAGVAAALDGRWPAGKRLCAALAAHALLVWLAVDRFRDVPAHGLTLCLLALVASRGTREWFAADRPRDGRLRRGLLFVCLGIQVVICDQSVRAMRRHEAEFAARARAIYAEIGDEGRVAGSFRTRRLYEWYAKGRTPAGLTVGYEALAARSDTAAAASGHGRSGAGRRPEIRLMDLPSPELLPRGACLEPAPDDSWRYVPP